MDLEKIDFYPYLNSLSGIAWNRKPEKKKHNSVTERCLDGCISPFFLDFKKILRSKAFRRLKDKAQVFCLPENPHIRTRAVHTLEVYDLAVTMAKLLGLNQDLAGAIAIGHDIGHAPFGHIGEEFISQKTGKNFRHNVFGVVVAEMVERQGHGLLLTEEVKKGIISHSRGSGSMDLLSGLPEEANLVMYADKIHYTFADVNDGLRYGYFSENELPKALSFFGSIQREREMTAIYWLVRESSEKGKVWFESSDTAKVFEVLRRWIYGNFYLKIDRKIFFSSLETAYDFLSRQFQNCDPALLLALLTDKEVRRIADLALAHKRIKARDIGDFGILEIVPYIEYEKIDIFSA